MDRINYFRPRKSLAEISLKGYILVSIFFVVCELILLLFSKFFGNLNIWALFVYLGFIIIHYYIDVEFLVTFFWIIIMSTLNLFGILSIENFSVYLTEFQETGSYSGAFIPMSIFYLLMFVFMGIRRKSKTKTNKQFQERHKKILKRGTHSIITAVTILGICIAGYLLITNINRPYFLMGVDRLVYAKEYTSSFNHSLKSYLPMFIPVAVMCFKQGKKRYFFLYMIILLWYYFWVGDKFGAYLNASVFIVLSFYNKINKKSTMQRIFKVVIFLFFALLLVVYIQRILLFDNDLSQTWDYLMERLAQQGEVWWSVYRQGTSNIMTHLSELHYEFKAILSGGSLDNKELYGQWKMMFVSSSYSNYSRYRIDIGNPYTATTAASLYYYFGLFGPTVFYPVFGWVYSGVIEKAKKALNEYSVFEAVLWVKIITIIHQLSGASDIHYLLSYKGLTYIFVLFIVRNIYSIRSMRDRK